MANIREIVFEITGCDCYTLFLLLITVQFMFFPVSKYF
jgi:hypothetical protein